MTVLAAKASVAEPTMNMSLSRWVFMIATPW
jgi:hypothetical protein